MILHYIILVHLMKVMMRIEREQFKVKLLMEMRNRRRNGDCTGDRGNGNTTRGEHLRERREQREKALQHRERESTAAERGKSTAADRGQGTATEWRQSH